MYRRNIIMEDLELFKSKLISPALKIHSVAYTEKIFTHFTANI